MNTLFFTIQITPNDVEFWNKEVEVMESMHDTKEYPPKLTIEVSGEQAVHESEVKVTFTGVDDLYVGNINTHISLLHPQAPMHSVQSAQSTLAISRTQSYPG